MSTTTLGTTTTTGIIKHEDRCVSHSFECDAQVNQGALVKLNTDGTVSPVSAVTDKPLGVVIKGNKAADENVTVLTPFVAIGNAVADGAVTAADELAGSGQDANGKQDFAPAAATHQVSAIALTGGADDATILVGYLRSAYIKS